MSSDVSLVSAIIRPFRLDQVMESLARAEIPGATITEVKGYGQKGYTEIYRAAEFTADHLPMIKIELAVATRQRDKAIEAILRAARTGEKGDGSIFISQLDQVLNIRTGIDDNQVPPLAA